MSEWRLGRPVQEPPSIWRRPAQAGLVVAVLFVATAVLATPPELWGVAPVSGYFAKAIEGFILGFFGAVILLTYSHVTEGS
jgi:pilus assembly protein TadC